MAKRFRISNNLIFSFLLLTTFVILIVNISVGEKQDQVYIQDANKLVKAENLLEEGKYPQAESLFAELADKHPESYQIQWNYGRCLALKGDYAMAKQYYDLTCEIAPLVVREPSFLFELGVIEYELRNYGTASTYLQVVKLINSHVFVDKRDMEKLETILKDISDL